MAQQGAADLERRMVDRMLFFSDAVFAIALTLLVLELRPPAGDGLGEAGLWAGLADQAPHFFAMAVSFALAGMWWGVHLAATRGLARFDWPSAVLNLVFLLFITLLPFAAALFGAHVMSAAALAVYWMLNAGAAIAMTALYLTMTRGGGRLLHAPVAARARWANALRSLIPGLAFLAGAWFALDGQIWVSRFCWVVIIPGMIVAGIVRGRAQSQVKRAA